MSRQQDHQGDQDGAEKDDSILARLRAAGIGEDRARSWIVFGEVRVDGEAVSDPMSPAPWPAPWTLTNL